MESGWNSIQNLPLYYFDKISTCMFFICYLLSLYFLSTFCLLPVYFQASACYSFTAPLCFYISCLSSPYPTPHKVKPPLQSSAGISCLHCRYLLCPLQVLKQWFSLFLLRSCRPYFLSRLLYRSHLSAHFFRTNFLLGLKLSSRVPFPEYLLIPTNLCDIDLKLWWFFEGEDPNLSTSRLLHLSWVIFSSLLLR